MSEFHFLRPYWLLAVLPVLILLWQLWRRHLSSRGWRAVCDARLLPFLLVNTAGRQRRWPVMLLAIMLVISIVSLAGPAWKKIPQPVFRDQSALVIILDLSRSMDAADIKPSRLARARLKVIDILRRRREGQTALLVYAATAFTVSPLTDDSNTIVALDKTLTTDLMPEQGSRPEQALQLATQLLHQGGVTHGDILLITDGIANSDIARLAAQVTGQGHRLSVLAVGTRDGAPITLAGGGFVKDSSGNIVIPKLTPAALQQLAQAGGGRFHLLSNDDTDISYVLGGMHNSNINAQAGATSFIADQWQEEGPWLLLLVLPFAALAFRRGYFVFIIMLSLPALPQPAHAFELDQLWQRPEQRAARQLPQNNSSEPPPSAEVFSDPEWKASAYYRAGEYEKAVKELQGIDKPDALYNTGNALAKMGKLEEALHAYDQALKKAPEHADAKYNREQVEKRLKQQQQKQDKDKSKQQQSDKNSSSQKQSKDQQPSQDKSQSQRQQEKDKGQASDQKDQKDQQDKKDQQGQPQQDQAQQDEQKKQAEQAKRQAEQDAEKAQQDKDQNQVDEPQQARPEDRKQDESAAKQPMADVDEREKKERQQANEQWLRRIPDDPGGLLRRKFQYQYQRDQQEGANNHDGQQAW